MAKAGKKAVRKSGRAARAPAAAGRRVPALDGGGEHKGTLAPAGSPVMSLLGEVERLQSELEWARARLAEIEAKADVDPLLNILNRRGFERELKRALAYVKRYGTRAALIYLDLDGFKPINDAHGHAAGDAALQAVALALQANVRASDTVARIGGDEFVVLLWNLDAADAAAKAAALESLISDLEIPFGVKNLSVGVSAGSTVLEPLDEAHAVLVRADQAMYRRKAGRRFAPAGADKQFPVSPNPSGGPAAPASGENPPRKAIAPPRPGKTAAKRGAKSGR